LGSLKHIFIARPIALHELGGKMTRPKAKYTERISAEKRINVDLSRVVYILS
jgi:hypothetical protein